MSRVDALRPYVEGMFSPRRWWTNLRHPVDALRNLVGDGPVFALVVLFGLNAVDELDRTGFGILLPTIRDHFGMSDTGILSLVALTALGALLLQLPIAWWADRGSRVRLAMFGGIAWGVFSFMTGLSATVWMLVLVRSGAGIGRAVVDPTHSSLLSDYYAVDRRPAVFSLHRSANAVGQFVGPLAAGALSHYFGWQVPFFVFAVPTVVFVVLAMKLKEPIRGAQERRAMGASQDAIDTEEPSASFGEAWRMVWKIESLRRIWYAIPFLAVSIIGFVSLAGLLYDRVYQYDDLQRGILASLVEPFQLVGLAVGGRVGVRLLMKDPALVFRFLRYVAFASGAWAALFAWSPGIVVTVIANIGLTSTLAILLPGILASLSLAIPARARAVGFSVASYWAIPGLVFVPAIGWVSDHWGIRWGMLMMTPLMVIGGLMISSVAGSIKRDIDDVWTASSTRSQALFQRRAGRAKLLLVKDLNVSYGSVQVLFDVSVEIGEGEVVALLGTNGAGKSTLLKAISGITEADFGAVIFDGRDITHAPPHEIAVLGVGQMPGGHGVFPALTVAENLRAAGWTSRRAPTKHTGVASALEAFPVLATRLHEPAANLSGGQQQMLALAMNLINAPRLLMIDELSLGLAPVVVERLAEMVREVAAGGTTIILVEQSVNVALTLADTAYFMEKGEIRFSGPTAELLDRPDLLRSVFLGKAVEAASASTTARPHPEPVGPGVALATHDLTVTFGGIRAVDSVDIEVADREIVGLIGPNGAGKTTLFDLICGYTAKDRGRVVLGGEEIGGLAPHRIARLGLGRSFQDAALFSSLTVEETIAVALDRWVAVTDPINAMLRLPASIESEDHVRRRVDELIDLFDLDGLRNRFVSELSTGSRRIVDLACVVAHSPSVLLLDEPSSGIAQRETEALGPLITRLRDELGCAIVVIEHDMPLLASVCDRLVALESGGLVAAGPVAEVLADERVISSYLGTTPEVIDRSGAVGARPRTGPSEPAPEPNPPRRYSMSDTHGQGLRPSERPPIGPVAKYGPLATILVVLAALVALVATNDPGVTTADTTTTTAGRGAESLADVTRLPDGVETFARAEQLGTAESIDWGERCDTAIGKVKMPLWPQPDCFKPFTGDNGGATAQGVTADSVKIVVYLPQADDPVLKFIYAQIGNNDTPDQTFATNQGFAEIFNTYYEMYGRQVELVRYNATGAINDSTAATADAETIAGDLQPFLVIGGPNLTNAFADTLANNGIACIACTPAQPAAWYEERSPYVWDVSRNADQGIIGVAEYLGKRLVGRPAEFAGDTAMHTKERVFGYIHVVSSDASQELEDKFTGLLRDTYGLEFAAIQTYALPTDLAGSGKDIITKMKEAGVTTVVFSGDPLAPQTLTKIATEQEYFPEWVLGQSVLVDTAVFSRTYDQRQWAHAFGPSGLFARATPGTAGPGFLYQWYFGEEAPAVSTVPLIAGPLQILFGALQGMGPAVSHEMFKTVLFGSPILPSTPISPQVSFGNRGFFPDPDYSALDDLTEIWWDPNAEGQDELKKQAKGLWRYVDGGKRVLPGEWEEEQPHVFDPDRSILIYDKAPAGAELKEYEPLR